MTGVEILAVQEVIIASTFNCQSFWTTMGITVGLCALIGIITSIIDLDLFSFVLFLIIGVIMGLLFGTLSGAVEGVPSEYETQYKVVVSDEVSMNEFVENYEILAQEGKIYTVRERD